MEVANLELSASSGARRVLNGLRKASAQQRYYSQLAESADFGVTDSMLYEAAEEDEERSMAKLNESISSMYDEFSERYNSEVHPDHEVFQTFERIYDFLSTPSDAKPMPYVSSAENGSVVVAAVALEDAFNYMIKTPMPSLVPVAVNLMKLGSEMFEVTVSPRRRQHDTRTIDTFTEILELSSKRPKSGDAFDRAAYFYSVKESLGVTGPDPVGEVTVRVVVTPDEVLAFKSSGVSGPQYPAIKTFDMKTGKLLDPIADRYSELSNIDTRVIVKSLMQGICTGVLNTYAANSKES